MKAVNAATQTAINVFMTRADSLPLDQHPYSALTRGLNKLDKTEWDDEDKNAALAALVMWITATLGGCVAGTLNEILAVMRIAHATNEDGKKAAEELASSMPFLEKVVHAFLTEIDIRHLAETLFENGRQRTENGQTEPITRDEKTEQKQPETSAPLQNTPTLIKKQIQNWLPTRFKPSAN